MDGHLRVTKKNFGSGHDADRKAGGNGFGSAPCEKCREYPRSAGNHSQGVRVFNPHSQESDCGTRQRRRFYVQDDGKGVCTDPGTERMWKSGAEAGILSERKKTPSMGTGYSAKHDSGRSGQTRKGKTAERKRSREIARQFQDELKKRATSAEREFQNILNHAGIMHKFQSVMRRSASFFIVDFFLIQYGVVVEIDGGYHDTGEQISKDALRTKELMKKNGVVRVIRFKNEEVFMGNEYVLRKLAQSIVPWAFSV